MLSAGAVIGLIFAVFFAVLVAFVAFVLVKLGQHPAELDQHERDERHQHGEEHREDQANDGSGRQHLVVLLLYLDTSVTWTRQSKAAGAPGPGRRQPRGHRRALSPAARPAARSRPARPRRPSVGSTTDRRRCPAGYCWATTPSGKS